MKLITIVNARLALQKLVTQELPIRTAWKVMELTEECNLHLRFYGEELQKLGPEPAEERLRELQDLDIPELDARVKIEIPLVEDVRLSAADIKSLDPFIDFKEG